MAEETTKELVRSERGRFPFPMRMLDVDRWFDEAFRRPFAPFRVALPQLRVVTEEVCPSVDIFEEGNDLVFKAELPGMKKEDIDITITECCLSISGEKKKDTKIERKDYFKWESSYGSFCRTFEPPYEVQCDKAKSTYKDGVLEIRMPKSEATKSKEVKVKVE